MTDIEWLIAFWGFAVGCCFTAAVVNLAWLLGLRWWNKICKGPKK